MIVGYDDPHGCWIVKNSWGTGLGDNGYWLIAYGQCNIDVYGKETARVALPEQTHNVWHAYLHGIGPDEFCLPGDDILAPPDCNSPPAGNLTAISCARMPQYHR